MSSVIGRRAVLSALVAAAGGALHAQQPQAPTAGSGETGRLFNPDAAGRPREPTARGDADAEIQAIEQKLACHCGCTLDIFTCRTTDFTCTTSPRLHQEVVALHQGGADAQEILDTFKAKYGEQALMAPEAKGFNLAGYLVPGIVILLLGAMLAWVIGRRHRVATESGAVAAPVLTSPVINPEGEERLRRALSEVED